MNQYLRILRHPGMATLLGAAMVARLPFSINALGIVLFLREQTGEFSAAGAVAGAMALGAGCGAPVMGRIVDRRGSRVLLLLAAGNATGVLSLLALGSSDAPLPLLMAVAFVAGFSYPPSPSVLRARFPELLGDQPELVPSAYALDSVLLELSFVCGPLLVAAVVATVGPGAALVLSAASVVGGVAVFVAALPPDEHPIGHVHARSLLSVLRAPGISTLVMTMVPVGFAIGSMQVSLPAFTHDESHPELAGVLLATWSISAACGGFVYGLRQTGPDLAVLHHRLTLMLPLALLLPLMAPSIPVMALLLMPAGSLIAPIIATRNQLASEAAPPGTKTEALTWPLTALVAGLSSGTALGGILIDSGSWRTAIFAGVLGAAAASVIATTRRTSLRAAVATARSS
jgi:predicted MFS family arabinose efflux permease